MGESRHFTNAGKPGPDAELPNDAAVAQMVSKKFLQEMNQAMTGPVDDPATQEAKSAAFGAIICIETQYINRHHSSDCIDSGGDVNI